MSEKDINEKEECDECLGSDQMIDEDFCSKCGQPSADYKQMIYEEAIENGQLRTY